MPKRAYTCANASVRFRGPTLDPLVVTQELRLPPDFQHRDGEPRLVRTTKGKVQEYAAYRGGLWSMSSKPWVDSPRLETHLKWLLKQLEPHTEAIQGLLETGIEVDFFCYSLGTTDRPPSISCEVQERSAKLGIAIEIDHYSDNEEQ